jgi:hypothetical protein
MRRGWSSFADTRQITFSNTIGEDHRIRHFLAAVCRRRWPSGRRLQAPQRPADLREVICRANQTGAAGTVFSGGGCLWSEAEPASLETANLYLNDLFDLGIFQGALICLLREGWVFREGGVSERLCAGESVDKGKRLNYAATN